jgi:hypothetical protein
MRQVLIAVGGATAVAEEDHLAAGFETRSDRSGNPVDCFGSLSFSEPGQ